MDRVIEALKAYDHEIWRQFHRLEKPKEKQDERPPAGLPSKDMYHRCPAIQAWKDSLGR